MRLAREALVRFAHAHQHPTLGSGFGSPLPYAAQLAVVRLRIREPELERPFRVPGSVRVGGAGRSVLQELEPDPARRIVRCAR